MNILVISPYFYPHGGGAEKYTYKILEGLTQRGNNVTVLCSNQEKRNKEDVIGHIRIVRLTQDFNVLSTSVSISLFVNLINFLRSENLDLIIVNFYLPYYQDVGALTSRLYRFPTVLIYHNDIAKTGFWSNLIAQFYNYFVTPSVLYVVNRIITPSPFCFYESRFLKPFRNKLVWIPPGVDIKRFSVKKSFKIHQVYGLKNSSKIVLFVGNMSKASIHKGVNQLIKAFSRVLKDVQDAYLVLVGKGNMIPYYKKLCKDFRVSERVIFTGFVDEETLIEYYQSSNCVVLPSTTIQEGFGMTLIEGSACGKPVIGTEIGGIKYVIRNYETGLLVPPNDYKALANAIINVLKDENLAKMLGTNGRRLVEKRYTWDKAIDASEKVCREIITKTDNHK